MYEPEFRELSSRRLVVALIILGIAIPWVSYSVLLRSAATITPWQAKEWLRHTDDGAVLVDVRPRVDFEVGHLDGAVHWPREELLAAASPRDVPAALQNRNLLVIDNTGWASLHAARHLRRIGTPAVCHVRGGVQEWILSVTNQEGELFDRWRSSDGIVTGLPFREPDLREQIISVTAFFLVKPIYTLMSLLVIVFLWRETSPDLVALRWGMIFFFVGENACALNVLAWKETSYLLEYAHSVGMAICLGFVTYALLEGLDRRVVGWSAPNQRCAAMSLCGTCIKHADVPCGLRRMLTMFIPLCIVVACILPTADWHDAAYNTTVFGQFYHYGHLRVFQMFENWVCSAAAVLCFSVTLLLLQFPGKAAFQRARIMLAAGVGPLGFGLLRVFMGGVYSQSQVWFGFWEEMTELLLLAGICFTLWTFRAQLLPAWTQLRARLGT